MILFSILFAVVAILFIIYTIRLWNDKPEGFPPGPPRLPFWGGYWFMLKENYFFSHRSLKTLAEKYKTKILGIYLGPFPTVALFNYDLCKEVLTRDEFVGRVDNIIARTRGLGKLIGIFFADGLFWKEQRRFGLRHLRDYGFGRRSPDMENFVERELKDLIDFMTSDPKPDDFDVCRKKGEILMPDVFYGPLINTIMHPLSTKKTDNFKLREVGRAAIRFMRSFDATGCAIGQTPWLRHIAPDFFGFTSCVRDNAIILDFLREVVREHRESFIPNQPRDFIDIYIEELDYLKETDEEYSTFSEDQMLWLVMDFMFPSPVGVGHTLHFTFTYLLNHPEVQEKIHQEIDSIVGRSRLPSLDDRKDMPYSEATIREVMRIDGIAPLGIARRAVQDTHLGGYFIPKDTMLLPCLWAAHNDPTIFKDPEMFNPERWLDADGKLLKKDMTIPFGAGKRLCAGETYARQTLFLIIAGLLQNFVFKPATGKKPPNPQKQIPGFTISIPEFWMQATWRE